MKKLVYDELLYLDKNLQPAENLEQTITNLTEEVITVTNGVKNNATDINTYNDLVSDYTSAITLITELMGQDIPPNWIKGELKWVKVGTTMPEGWVKVIENIEDGFTVVQGTEKGITKVTEPFYHYHTINIDVEVAYSSAKVESADLMYDHPGKALGDFIDIKVNSFNSVVDENKSEYNLVAGIPAELWRYEG